MGKKSTLSFLPLRGMVLFPNNGAHIDIGRDKSIAALEESLAHDRLIMLCAQKDIETEDPKIDDVYEVGTVCQVQHVSKLNNGIMRAQIEGLYRAKILDYRDDGLFIEVDVEEIEDDKPEDKEIQALIRACISKFEDWVKLSHKIPPEVMIAVNVAMDDGHILCNVITNHLNCKFEDKQEILQAVKLKERLEGLYKLLQKEIEIMELENKIVMSVNQQMTKTQKDYYLREQIKAINKELGEDDDITMAIDEYRSRMEENDYPDYVVETLEKELKIALPLEKTVTEYAYLASQSGLDGVVCSPLEAGKVKDVCGKGFLTVTPGVRFADGEKGDQVRVTTPARAAELGSDYIVVGRPITAAADPVAAYERACREFLGE